MWISGKVELPDGVIDAMSENRLVVFAGAGVSVDPPAGLPSYLDLIKQLGADAHRPLQPIDLDQPDVLLGSLADGGMPLKERVVQLLTVPSSRPNPYHLALVSMFRDCESVRIVTTNHDTLFNQACLDVYDREPELHFAPGLPVGDDFTGIVYLHGSVLRDSRHLVLTDDDFGRAYLTQGWATTFLRAMYAEFDVLFVGYSHGEPVLRYLARGLSTRNDRHALTSEDANVADWRRLGITPILYPLAPAPQTHALLQDAVTKWAELATAGNLEHQQRIQNLLAKPPVLTPDEQDYLFRVLANIETSRLFAAETADPSWLKWILEVRVFVSLFTQPDAEPSAVPLADWFCRNFLLVHTEEALSAAQRLGTSLSRALWIAIAHTLWTTPSRPESAVFGRWAQVLIESAAYRDCPRYLEYLLGKCRWPEDRETALLLFEYLTQPHPILEPRLGLDDDEDRVRVRVVTRGDADVLRPVWSSLLLPHIGEIERELDWIVTRNLEYAQLLTRSAGDKGSFGPLSLGRSRIESSPEDE